MSKHRERLALVAGLPPTATWAEVEQGIREWQQVADANREDARVWRERAVLAREAAEVAEGKRREMAGLLETALEGWREIAAAVGVDLDAVKASGVVAKVREMVGERRRWGIAVANLQHLVKEPSKPKLDGCPGTSCTLCAEAMPIRTDNEGKPYHKLGDCAYAGCKDAERAADFLAWRLGMEKCGKDWRAFYRRWEASQRTASEIIGHEE